MRNKIQTDSAIIKRFIIDYDYFRNAGSEYSCGISELDLFQKTIFGS